MKERNKKTFTLTHRILHWTMAFGMPILFITGFLRMYWMNKNGIVEIIASKTSALPKDQMVDIAKAIRQPMWQWHELFYYIIVIAFLARIIYMLVNGMRFPNPFKKNIVLKERLQGFTYIYFYIFVLVLIFTGVSMQQNLLPAFKSEIATLHKWGIYYFPIFIVLHFVGIVLGEISNKKGISSKMIGGD